ncbi:MAG TPA: hypothetical protein VGE24_09585 [Emticicia sp.]
MEEWKKWYPSFWGFVRRDKEPATETASEKVDATVTTFLPEDSAMVSGYQDSDNLAQQPSA